MFLCKSHTDLVGIYLMLGCSNYFFALDLKKALLWVRINGLLLFMSVKVKFLGFKVKKLIHFSAKLIHGLITS